MRHRRPAVATAAVVVLVAIVLFVDVLRFELAVAAVAAVVGLLARYGDGR